MSIGKQIREFRQGKKITQISIAKKTGIDKRTICRYENHSVETLDNIDKMIEAIDARIIIVDKDAKIYIEEKNNE